MTEKTPLETKLLRALHDLLISAVDQRNGYLDRDLHEPWGKTAERARNLLILHGVDIDD